MKTRPGFTLREVANHHVVIPVGKAAVDFSGMLTLNGTGAFLWELLSEERTKEELLDAMTRKFEVTSEQASSDIDIFLAILRDNGLLLEN